MKQLTASKYRAKWILHQNFHFPEATMAIRKPSDLKIEALRQHGCVNPKPDAVLDGLFMTVDFFDPCDLLQVRYEMVRRVRVEEQPINQTARSFGFSRPTVYQALRAFERGGAAALLPQRPGPRRAHKLNEEVVEFLNGVLAGDPGQSFVDLAAVLLKRFGLSVHPSSIERALRRQKKKP